MIDIENEVYTIVRNAVKAKFPDVNFAGEYIEVPNSFPHVSMYSFDNVVYSSCEDSSNVEYASSIPFEINVYSNKIGTKKTECKAIAQAIDEQMALLGFNRTYMNPVPNQDSTIFRYVMRYTGVVDINKYVYRR